MDKHKKYKINNNIKIKAQNRALFLYPEPKPCSVTGCKDKNGERHHPDYFYPDEIIWLCRKHHKRLHNPTKHCVFCDEKIHGHNLCKKHYARGYRKQQGW